MQTVQIAMPDKLVAEVDHLVDKGWFADRSEVMHLALAEFVHRYRYSLIEQFQEADTNWALQHKKLAGEQRW